MKEDYDSMYDFVRDFNNECEEYKHIKRIVHPECPVLYKNIFMHRKEEAYFFDFNGDWYDKNWCKNPLEKCERDAMQEMNYILEEARGETKDNINNNYYEY